jgi:hypothetical protein
MNIAITLIAAMLGGTGFVLQQHAAEQAPKSYFLRLRLITTLLHRPRWLAGVAVMAAGNCSRPGPSAPSRLPSPRWRAWRVSG